MLVEDEMKLKLLVTVLLDRVCERPVSTYCGLSARHIRTRYDLSGLNAGLEWHGGYGTAHDAERSKDPQRNASSNKLVVFQHLLPRRPWNDM